MVFNSVAFLIFFILFFQFYWLINNRFHIFYRNIFIIFSSYLFYGWWDWRFLSLIFISSLSDYIIGLNLARTQKKSGRKLLLVLSISVNLGILGFFKYFNFFVDSLQELLQAISLPVHIKSLNIILPVGISFYTFQTLSYTIDIFNRKIQPTRDIASFFAFVSFFPQLVAGPIERAGHLLPQFFGKKEFSYNSCVQGLRLILWGLFKKIVIADNFGTLVDALFDTHQSVTGITTLAGTLLFAFQIYADFSGYSDIAIGLSKMLGFDLMKNFKAPYFSPTFGEFWHRWHISLSSWFRDYLYFPLGGSRKSKFRIQLNIMVTFLLSGLWHGANITFLIWGGLHGTALLLEKWLKGKWNRLFYAPLVFMVVTLLWIPFRAENYNHFIVLSKSIFQFGSYTITSLCQTISNFSLIRFIILSIVLTGFLGVEYHFKTDDFNEWIQKKSRFTRFSFYYVLLILLLLLGNFSVKPYFIYFQF